MSSEIERWKSPTQGHPALSTKLPWYRENCENKLTPSFRKLLEEWSKIPPGEVIPHIYDIRDRAWEVFPWVCIGEFWFIEQSLLRHPDFARVLDRMTSTTPAPKFLDLGTCVGQDVRTLLHHGAPPSAVYGADKDSGFREAGYAFFKDRDRLDESHFIAGNIFSDVDDLAQTRGTWDIIHLAMFLHIFSLEDQQIASRNIFRLLKHESGSTIIGTQTGMVEADEVQLQPPLCDLGDNKTIYRHSKETLKAMLERTAEEVGISVIVSVGYEGDEWTGRRTGGKEKWADNEEWRNNYATAGKERMIFFKVEVV